LRFMGSPQQESQLSSLKISLKAANMLSRDCGRAFRGLNEVEVEDFGQMKKVEICK
jgi:hypothetical protein